MNADPLAYLTADERAELDRLLKNRYLTFQKRYQYAPADFVRDAFVWQAGEHANGYQLDILGNLSSHGRENVRSLHGTGKTTTAAWAVLWFALTRDGWTDWKAPTTAGSWAQLERYLWPEIHKWARRLRWDVIGRMPFTAFELLYQKLKLSTGEAFAVASDQPELMEGAHASQMFYLLDEAKAILNPTWDAVEGAFTQEGLTSAHKAAYALAISTPGPPVGRFYDIQRRKPGYEDWHTTHITLEQAIACGQVSPTWAASREKAWGATSAVYKQRVRGEFAADDAEGIIPLAWVEAAIERWRVWKAQRDAMSDEQRAAAKKPAYLGADIARGGEDKNVYAPMIEEDRLTVISEIIRKDQKQDTMETTGQVVGLMTIWRCVPVIDVLNMGAGVVDRTREQTRDPDSPIKEMQVLAFNASVKSYARDSTGEFGFANLRSAGWWTLRERLDPASKANPLALPDDDMLIGDITAIRARTLSGAVLAVESKDNLKTPKRLGRSPDTGDAVMQVVAVHLVDPHDHFALGDVIAHDSLWNFGSGGGAAGAGHLSPPDWE